MIMSILYWFIGLLFLVLFIIWMDSLLFGYGKVRVHPSIERPLQRQEIWAHYTRDDKWVYGYFDSLTDYDDGPVFVSDGIWYDWDYIDYWVDLNEYKG